MEEDAGVQSLWQLNSSIVVCRRHIPEKEGMRKPAPETTPNAGYTHFLYTPYPLRIQGGKEETQATFSSSSACGVAYYSGKHY